MIKFLLCLFCEEQGHVSLFNCKGFKNASMTARCRFVGSHRLCWRCLERGHIDGRCPEKGIKVCDKYLHCKIACPCDYRGKKFISGASPLIGLCIVLVGKERGSAYL